MTQVPEPAATGVEAAPDAQVAPLGGNHAAVPVVPVRDHRTAPEMSDADRRMARQLLGAIITVGIAHLTHQRFYRSLWPYWLVEARREIDTATGTVEVFGGVLMFIPRLRKLARWINLAVLTPELLAAIGEARRPERLRPFSRRRVTFNPIGPLALAPGHAGLAGAVWWATED